MGHLLKNAFRWKLRNFVCIFWPLVFPLLLGTFFHIALGNIGNTETMQTISVALVTRQEDDRTAYFTEFLDSLSQGNDPMLKVDHLSMEKAQKALDQQTVHGIFVMDKKPSLTVGKSDIQASILETILNIYTQHSQVIEAALQQHPENLPAVMEAMKEDTAYLENVTLGGTSLDFSTQFFYALIAMASLYGGYMGLYASMKLQANVSPLGARRCITPTHKIKLILSELISSFVLHMSNLLILLAVLRYLYRVPLGGNLGYTVLIAAFGVLIGVSFGFFIGAAVKGSEGLKVGTITCFSMLSSACAGLMSPDVKISIQRSLPLLNRLNPAAAIADSLYYVHIYNSPAKMWECLSILGAMSLLLIFASFFVTRRERYASI